MSNITSVIGNYKEFLDPLLTDLEKVMDLSLFSQLDMLCFRTETLEEYKNMQGLLSKHASCISEAIVSGRPISIFKLTNPIIYRQWRIDFIELPAPKASSPRPSGLEHLQLVAFDSLEEIIAQHPSLEFDLGGIKRVINPMIELQLPSGNVKIHTLNIGSVVRIEHTICG